MARSTVYCHVDLDAFYASVEQLDKPELRGKPVIVGGSEHGRGVVSACSYEARTYGVHSAMPAAEARRRAPHAVFLPVRMGRYQEVSARIMTVLSEYTPTLQQISVDEAFLDLTGTQRLSGHPVEVGRRIKRRIHEAFGLTASVGIGATRFVAKMASDFDKPDGLHYVEAGGEEDFVLGLDLGDLWGLGRKTRSRLEALGITRVSHLHAQRIETLRGHFGEAAGTFLHRIARGIDPGIFSGTRKSHSISSETTFERDISDPEILEAILLDLCEQVMYRRYREGGISRTVQLKLRKHDFSTHTVRRSVPRAIGSTDEFYREARRLLDERWDRSPLRLLGCGLENVQSPESVAKQPELFDQNDRGAERRRRLEEAVFRLREGGIDIHKAGGFREERHNDPT